MTVTIRPRALYVLAEWAYEKIYGPDERRDIAEMVDIYAALQTPAALESHPDLLRDAEIILSGWGGPRLDRAFLNAAPRLKAFFYGAGATGGMICPEAWERGIVVASALSMNAIPVAEYTAAAIIFALKNVLPLMRQIYESKTYPANVGPMAGAYKTTIGLVSLGAIGRAVRERLRWLDVTFLACDPFVSAADAQSLQIELVSLDELFRRSDVVSIHTPWLPETERLIAGTQIAAMKPNATLINTARGAVIAEDEMISALARRPDLTAVLDVTHPEPPAPDSPLYHLPNVFLTPHIAGSVDAECRRMGRFIAEELRRYLSGEPLAGLVRPEAAQNSSHRVPNVTLG